MQRAHGDKQGNRFSLVIPMKFNGKYFNWRGKVTKRFSIASAPALFLVMFLIFAQPVPCQAQDVSAHLQEARDQIRENRIPEAIDSLRTSIRQVWSKAGLSARASVLTQAPAKAYGMFVPRESNLYNSGEPIYLYVEPIGFNVIKNGEEFEFGLIADFVIRTPDGNELYEQKEFDSWIVKSRRFITEFSINLECKITGLKMGTYILEVKLRDMNGTSTADIESEIRIR
jgi:hypothetical protein